MSGGSMNYLYSKLELDANFCENTPERRAFAKHLKLVAKAMHDIEWVDSGDYGPGDDTEAIRACLSAGATLEAAIDAAREANKALGAELERRLALCVDALKLCKEHFEREIGDDHTMADSDFGGAYRSALAAIGA